MASQWIGKLPDLVFHFVSNSGMPPAVQLQKLGANCAKTLKNM